MREALEAFLYGTLFWSLMWLAAGCTIIREEIVDHIYTEDNYCECRFDACVNDYGQER